MDYDDGDFQSQNFQLGGEDNKFPPSLRSYALPKFDVDEHLHLRFDSLVETEVLLGIESQEENHWIEDFSRGSSGIEFSSSAAESCSISMRNNVWSEATSSESVEMLLKSVGQDEMIAQKIVNEEKHACEGLDNQMDLSLNRNDFLPSKVVDAVDTDCTLRPDKGLKSSSGSSEHVAGDLPKVEYMPHTHLDKISGFENLSALAPGSASEKYGTYINIAAEHCNLDQNRTSSSVDKSIQDDYGSDVCGKTSDIPDNSSVECVEVDPLAPPTKDSFEDAGVLNDKNIPQDGTDGCSEVLCDKPEGLLKDDAQEAIEVFSKDIVMNGQHCKEHPEDGSDKVENASGSALKADSSVQKLGHDENVFFEKPVELLKVDSHPMESGVLRKDTEMGDDFMENTHGTSLTIMEGKQNIEHELAESSNNNSHLMERGVSRKDTRVGDDVMGSTHDTSLTIMEGKQNIEHELAESSNNDGTNLSSSIEKVYSATDIIHDARMIQIEDGHGDLGIHSTEDPEFEVIGKQMLDTVTGNDNSNPDVPLTESGYVIMEHDDCLPDLLGVNGSELHDSSSLHGKSLQSCDSYSLGRRPGDAHNDHLDIPIVDKENVGLSTSTHNIEIEMDGSPIVEKRVETSSQGESTTTITAVRGSHSEQSIVDVSVSSGIVLGDVAELVSLNKLGENNQVTDDNVEQKVGMSHLPGSDLILSNKKGVSVTGISAEPCALALEVECNSYTSSRPIPDCDSGQHSVCNKASELLPEMGARSSASVDKSVNSLCQNEPQTSQSIMTVAKCDQGLDGHPAAHVSVMKELDSCGVGVTSKEYEVRANTTGSTAGEKIRSGEILKQPVISSVGESCDISQRSNNNSETNLVSVDDNDGQMLLASPQGDTQNCHEETSFKPLTMSENFAESHPVEGGSANPTFDEPNCGSPTIISCSEPSQSKKECQEGGDIGPSHQNVSISNDLPQIRSDIHTHANDVKSTANDPKDTANDPKENQVSEDDRSFTFEVTSLADLPERETEKGWKPLSGVQPFELSQTRDTSTTSSLGHTDPEIIQEAFHGGHRLSDVQKVHVGTKGSNENKTKSVSGSATEKKTTTQVKATKKSSHRKKPTEKDRSPFNASPNLVGISRPTPVEELRQYSCIEGSSLKAPCVPIIQASNLPDLNSSAVTIFHQPFTDLQQVQLRAQIFVYGSLIQGTPPDEGCMLSAFGDTSQDGGRSSWENVWRLAVERFHNQKSPLSYLETPLHSRSGVGASEQVSKCTPLQSKTHNTPTGRTGSKGAPSAIVSSVMSLSSPVWSISTPSRDGLQSSTMPRGPFLDSHQSLSPLHPYQSPHMRHYVGGSTPWPSQAPCPVPWVVTPQSSTIDASVQYSALPIAEAVQVTSIRDSTVTHSSNMQLAPSSPLVTAGGSVSVPEGTAMSMDAKRTTTSSASGKLASTDQKSRKRKKNLMSEELGRISSVTLPRTEPASATDVAKHFTTSVGISSPAHPESRAICGVVPSSSPIASSTHYQVVIGSDMDQRVVFSDETCSRIEEAKQHAEDAAAVADSAVRHSQGIWSQLAIQKSSELVSDVEIKLASAAVAAAAASSVAKAAAAAAKVASAAALQAKLMADEAMTMSMSKMGNSIQAFETGLSDSGKNLGMISPALILKGNDKTNASSSIIVAAREVARKRVEAASAAAKRAENLDAVVKAAELAAAAVSQVGIIIAMGDPIPMTLSELDEAGPDGYWRVHPVSSQQLKAKHLNERPSNKKGTQRASDKGNMPSKELAILPVESQSELVNAMQWGSVTHEKGLAAQYEGHRQSGVSNENNIMEGSDVEVVSDEDGLRGVWFSAKVLSSKDGKVYVCYNELPRDEGPEKLKEWISLEGEGNKAPRIRIAHPLTAMKFEGTRKRRRAAMGNYIWSVGDRVDAWMRDGWWEGTVTEKSKEDETKLTVQFTAGGESSIVRSWNLRPSLVWKDGQWMEWSRENNSSRHEGDTPQDKRQKLGTREVDPQVAAAVGEDKLSKIPCNENSKISEESRSLMLSEKDRIFSVGKDITEDNNSNALRMKRTGLQKEESRVVFGVPKPGKKRKFMEVSKHYIADHAPKMNEGTDSIKFAKYLMPQGSRGWRNTSKVDLRGKAPVESKPKMLKSGKAHVIQGKSVPEKDNSSLSVVSTSSEGIGQDPLPNLIASSLRHDKNQQNLLETGTFSNGLKVADGPVLFSSLGLASDVPSSKKKPSSAVGAELGTKGKRAPAGERLARNEVRSLYDNPGRVNPDSNEPRRSNRRIMPTSRLLEGLQSSLIISKIPPVLHDKGVKGQHRGASSSRGNNHG